MNKKTVKDIEIEQAYVNNVANTEKAQHKRLKELEESNKKMKGGIVNDKN